MDLKQKISFILISIILLSATALAAPTADCTNAKKAPVAAFSASPTSGYAPLKIQFTDKSKYSPTSWKWSFGDGTYSTAKNPVHTYSKVGKYTVTLAVKNSKGSNKITRYSYITVLTSLKAPVANFSASPTSGYAPLKVQFTDKSKYSPTSWKWSFGDGTYSTAKNPAHTYSKTGTYNVSLTIKNVAGANTKTINGYITVNAVPIKPVANFSASPASGYSPLKVQFTDNSTGTPTSWKWNFGDGSNSTEKNPVHTYNETGKYNVSLTVKNVKGTNEITKYNYITADSSTAIDPVCKMKVDKATAKFTSEYKGTTYYFCSTSCKEKFDENPEKYVSSEISENNSETTENETQEASEQVTSAATNNKDSMSSTVTQEASEQVTSAATNSKDSTSSTVVDPVCKMEIDKNTAEFTSVYKGTTYYFCSASCKEKFDANPEKYINS